MEPEVEVVEFEISEVEGIATSEDIGGGDGGDFENPVDPNPGWGW